MPSSDTRRAISGQILLGERLDVGVGRGGGRALVLADLRRHLVRGGHRDVRDAAPRSAAPPPPRGAGWRRRAGTRSRWPRRPPSRARGPRGQHRASRRSANRPSARMRSVDLETQLARHQRLGLGDGQVVQLVLALAPDLERVREAGGGDEAGHRALALDQRVGEERGGVDGPGERARVEARLGQQSRDAGGDRARRVVVGGEDLAADAACPRRGRRPRGR